MTGGADAGVGFHSAQPVSISRFDPTEQTHFKNKQEESQTDVQGQAVSTYPKYHESPFTRYVRRPLSDGVLSNSVVNYKLEDRSTMGVPLNPFWIRNDLWSMANEADIFMTDGESNFVAPRVTVPSSVPQGSFTRSTYLENQEQPQQSTEAPDIKASVPAPPMASAAGSVTGAVVASDKTQMEIPQSNPAIPGQQGTEGKEGELKAVPEAKKGSEGAVDLGEVEDLPPPKKKSRSKKVSS